MNTLVHYSIHLKEAKHFKVNCIFASFYASRSFLPSNVNWLRTDLSSVGLLLFNIYLICSPALLPHLNTGVGSLNVMLPQLIQRVVRNFVPLTRGHENYNTVGGLLTFASAKQHITDVRSEVTQLIKKGSLNTHGYQIGGLVDDSSYLSQLRKLESVLLSYESCDSPELLAQKILVCLSMLHVFKSETFNFCEAEQVKAGPIDNSTSTFGIRKYVSLSDKYVAFFGDPSHFSLSLHRIMVAQVSMNVGNDLSLVVSSPIGGSSIVQIAPLTTGELFLSLLNSRITDLSNENFVKSSPQFKRETRFTTSPSFAPGQVARPDGKRKLSTLVSREIGEHPIRLYVQDGIRFRFIGFLIEE